MAKTPTRTQTAAGLIELGDLAVQLQGAGVTVYGGGAFTEAGQEIIQAFSSGHRIPIIVRDVDSPALRQWLEQIAASQVTDVVVLHDGERPEHQDIGQAVWVSLPASLSDILASGKIEHDADDPALAELYPEPVTPTLPVLPAMPAASALPAMPEPAPEPAQAPSYPEIHAPQEVQALSTHVPAAQPAPPWTPPPSPAPAPSFAEALWPRRAPEDPEMDFGSLGEPARPEPEQDEDVTFGVVRRADVGCPVIVCTSGRGGVGKSTTSIQLATTAGMAGLRVVLIDGNVGQADIARYLGVKKGDIPTITAMASTRRVADSVTTHDRLAGARGRHSLAPFELIAGPDAEDAAQGRVTPATYIEAISWARARADLVVVDTQITESMDRSGMVDEMVVPILLSPGAWMVGVSDMTNVGLTNLRDRLKRFNGEHGIRKDHMLVFTNKVPAEVLEAADEKARQGLGRRGAYLRTVVDDPMVASAMNRGETDLDGTGLHELVLDVLYRVTGREEFITQEAIHGQSFEAETAHPAPAKSGGFFSKLLGRRR